MTSTLPAIPTHMHYVHVMVLCKDESTYGEAVFGLDGCFRWGYDEPVIDDVEEWMPLPTRAAPEAPRQSEPVASGRWCIPVNGEWFYGTKEQCERERAEYESTFTELDREEAGVVLPEQIYSAPLSPDHSGGGAGVVVDERAEFENYYRDRIMGNRTGVRFLRSASGSYLDREIVDMWSGWQARAMLDKVKELNQ